jgi:hypothetical protein
VIKDAARHRLNRHGFSEIGFLHQEVIGPQSESPVSLGDLELLGGMRAYSDLTLLAARFAVIISYTLNLLIPFRNLIVNDLEFQSQVSLPGIALELLRQKFSLARQLLNS